MILDKCWNPPWSVVLVGLNRLGVAERPRVSSTCGRMYTRDTMKFAVGFLVSILLSPIRLASWSLTRTMLEIPPPVSCKSLACEMIPATYASNLQNVFSIRGKTSQINV